MSSSSSPDDRSHEGGVRLVPQPRRQPSGTVKAPPAPAKDTSQKKPQAQQLKNPDSPTPLGKGQRSAEPGPQPVQPNPFYYQQPVQVSNMGYPPFANPGYASESSATSSGYLQAMRMPMGYGTYISPSGGHHMVLASTSTAPTSSIDAIAAGMGGMKLRDYQREANNYIRHVQDRIYKLVQTTYQQENLPPQYRQELDQALKELTRDVGNLSGFVDQVASEADQAKNKDNERQTFQATAGVQAVEIERLRGQVEMLQFRLSSAEKNNEEVQTTYQNLLLAREQKNKEDEEKLKVCQEQLEGKRHLFYTAHDDVEGKARILSIVSDNDYHEKARIIQTLIDSAPQDRGKILEILFSNNAQAPAHNRSVSYQPTMMPIRSGSTTPASDLASWSNRQPARVTPPVPTMRRTPTAFHAGSITRPQSAHPGSIARPQSAHPNGTRFSQPRSRPSTNRSARIDAGAARYRFDDPDPPTVVEGAAAQELGSPQPSRARQMVLAQTQQTQHTQQAQQAQQQQQQQQQKQQQKQRQEQEWTTTIEIWKEEFAKIFLLVHGWASQYAAQVQEGQSDMIPNEAPRLWEFMCDILYPGQPEAGSSHARFLLDDPQCRPYFVERMMLQYIVNNVLSVEGWMGFSDDTDRELKDLNARLETTEVFKSYIRQSIIDQISMVIGRMLADRGFSEYRARRILFHQQRLKTIVGPLMDPSASRTDAGFDLHAVASTALQVSALMFQSRLDFDFSWSKTCSKFSVDFHVVKDAVAPPALALPLDPLMLQQKQYRIKLVITPNILFRDDRGVNVTTKRVLRSEVLVMS